MTDQVSSSNHLPIKRVIIPVGGFGTRMFPVTQAVPKPLLPVGDKPLVVHAVDEALEAGVPEVIIACRPEEYELYKRQFAVDDTLREKIISTNRDYLLDHLEKCDETYSGRVKIVCAFENQGPASTIKKLLRELGMEGEAFGVILPDDLYVADEPVIGQLMDTFADTGTTTVGVRDVCFKTEKSVNGTFVQADQIDCGARIVTDIQIKPKGEQPISPVVTSGRYVFGPDFCDYAEQAFDPNLNEVSMSAVLKTMLEDGQSIASHECKGIYYDCGDMHKFQFAVASFLSAEVLAEFNQRAEEKELAASQDVANDTGSQQAHTQ